MIPGFDRNRGREMKTTARMMVLLTSVAICSAQEPTIHDAKRELTAARAALKKVVTFCEACRETGKLEGAECPFCAGQGATLVSEAKLAAHKHGLELKAERLGAPRSKYADYDVGNRLEGFQKDIEPEAFKMFVAYVAYLKVFREYETLLEQDQRFKDKAARVVEQLDALVARHGPHLKIQSLRLLYEDDPVGKVGAFHFPGRRTVVRIDGKDVERVELRTLDQGCVLLRKDAAKPRDGFVLAEIVGKGAYETEDGQQITGILMQAY